MRRLASGLPTTAAGPVSPPCRISSREVRRSPALVFLPPWQSRHLATRSGRTSFSKNSSGTDDSAVVHIAAIGVNRGGGGRLAKQTNRGVMGGRFQSVEQSRLRQQQRARANGQNELCRPCCVSDPGDERGIVHLRARAL